jgi:aminoglycoside 2'-N-acetyltransferase I
VWDGDDLIGHGSVVQRQLIHTSQDTTHVLRTGYLEGMAVRADRRRQGVGRAIVVALNEVIRGAYELGALSAADEARRLYAANGWQPWRGRAFALTPHGVEPTADEEEGIFVLPVVEIDLEGNLTCDWREGDVW